MTAVSKLVRDRIPEIIRATGAVPRMRVATREEFAGLLQEKLTEEVGEFLDSGSPEELADVLEVLFALAAQMGISRAQLEEIRQAKAADRGGFGQRLVWLGNRDLKVEG